MTEKRTAARLLQQSDFLLSLRSLGHFPGLMVCVEKLVGQVAQRLSQVVPVQLLHRGVLVGVAQVIHLVQAVEHLTPDPRQLLTLVDGLAIISTKS